MSDGGFGIPLPEAQFDAVSQCVQASGAALHEVALALVRPLGQCVTDCDSALRGCQNRVKRSLGAKRQHHDKQLGKVLDVLAQDLLLRSNGVQCQLNELLSLPACNQENGQDAAEAGGEEAAPAEQNGECPVEPPVEEPPPEPVPPPAAEPADGVFGKPDVAIPEAAAPLPPVGSGPASYTPIAGFPPPGSPEFCDAADKLLAFFAESGPDLADWVNQRIDFQKVRDNLAKFRPDDKVTGIGATFARSFVFALTQLSRFNESVINGIRDGIKGVYKFYTSVFVQQSPAVLTGLSVWKSVLSTLHKLHIGVDPILFAVAGGDVNIGKLEQLVDLLIDYAVPIEPPGVPEAIEAWLRGYVGETQLKCVLRLHGLDPAMMEPYYRSRQELLSIRETLQYARRSDSTPEQTRAALRELGVVDDRVALQMMEMYWEIPSIADHLHWLQRQVFDEEYVQRYQLDNGFEEKFWPRFGRDLTILGMRKDNAKLHYEAHWIQPSPEQMREFVYRLRPDKVGVQAPFTPDDYSRLLAEQDYGILARQWFSETLYRVPALSYLRDMYRQYLLTDEEMGGYHRDLGYSPTDSERFVSIDKVVRERMRVTATHGWNPAAIAKAYAARRMDDSVVVGKMQELGYTIAEATALMERADAEITYAAVTRARSKLLSNVMRQVANALAAGVIDTRGASQLLVNIGWPEQQADAVVALEYQQVRVGQVKHAVNHLRSSLLNGEVDQAYAVQTLLQLGVTADAIQRYLSAWQLENTPRRKRRTAKQITTDLAEGQITTAEAAVKLFNLGYDDADRQLFLADASRLVVGNAAAIAESGQLFGSAKEDKLIQLARTTAGLSKRLVTELYQQAPPAKLQKWIVLGLLEPEQAAVRLRVYGWEPEAIALWIAEAVKGKEAADAKAAKGKATDQAGTADQTGLGSDTSGVAQAVPSGGG